jgi:hypothetical protein
MPAKDVQIHANVLPTLNTRSAINLREDVLFTNPKGEEKKGIRKRNEKALDQLQQVLPQLLQPDEVVLYVARCQSPASTGDQFTLGWYVYQVTCSVLVVTNRRILHFWVTPKVFGGRDGWTWRRSVRAVAWGDIAEAKVSGWLNPSVELKYRNGKKEKFWKFRGEDAKKIRLLAETILPGAASENTAAQGITSLCPRCFATLTPDIYQCAQCRLLFKDKATALRRSLLIPGGGYFYTGHIFLGISDAIVEGFLTLMILLLLLEIAGVTHAPPGEPPADWGMVIFFLILLGIEKLFTVYHANRFIRDYIPAE